MQIQDIHALHASLQRECPGSDGFLKGCDEKRMLARPHVHPCPLSHLRPGRLAFTTRRAGARCWSPPPIVNPAAPTLPTCASAGAACRVTWHSLTYALSAESREHTRDHLMEEQNRKAMQAVRNHAGTCAAPRQAHGWTAAHFPATGQGQLQNHVFCLISD